MIRVLIVDDDIRSKDYLELLLKEEKDISVCGCACSFEEALEKIPGLKPDLLFLDIELGCQTGFDLVKHLRSSMEIPGIIFVTGFDKYAIEAIRHAAIDYLLKPVASKELRAAIDRYIEKDRKDRNAEIENLVNYLKGYDKVLFNTRKGSIYINPDEIFYCEADGNYSKIVLGGNHIEYVSCQIGHLTEKLPQKGFLRLGRSYILNKKHLSRIERQRKTIIFESNGHKASLTLSVRLLRELGGVLEQ